MGGQAHEDFATLSALMQAESGLLARIAPNSQKESTSMLLGACQHSHTTFDCPIITKPADDMLGVINQHESNVRGYARLFPAVFDVARGSEIWDQGGRRYIDFFCGAGSLNYGHNNPVVKKSLLSYIERDGIQHSLDSTTVAKVQFIETFVANILRPRGLDYKFQFTGPTGTNSVEAALKLARKATGRSHVVAFTHGYHGHTLGSLALTANSYYHHQIYSRRQDVTHLPFDGYHPGLDSAQLLDQLLTDSSSGLPLPAAIILELVQGEGGVNVATEEWLRSLAGICRTHGVLLIVDDIQVGNGRTGSFFSFERAGIEPDLICMSKSIGGGLPMSFVLIRPELDVWKPGEHTGTFRGNNLAFVAAKALLEHYWSDDDLVNQIARRRKAICNRVDSLIATLNNPKITTRGRGLIQGIDLGDYSLARRVIDTCFSNGLVIEACGARDEVLKLMPALTIPEELLTEGLEILSASIRRELEASPQAVSGKPKTSPNLLSTDASEPSNAPFASHS
jgi:diaminobutyrate-2-oxoglutarate transaminase